MSRRVNICGVVYGEIVESVYIYDLNSSTTHVGVAKALQRDIQTCLRLLGLWLRLECSFDSLSIDPAHVIYLAEGHNVGSERQSSVMTLRKPIVTWII